MNSGNIRHGLEHGMFVREAAGEGPALLFIHGLGESGLCFEHLPVAPELAGRRLLLTDLPGYGRSPWLTVQPGVQAQSLAEQADHLAAWIGEKETGPVVLVGHSMGGVVALLLAERHPEMVAGLVDVDGNKSPGDCVFSSQAARWSLHEFCGGGFDTLRDAVHEKGVTDRAQRGYHVSMRLADPQAYYRNSLELVQMSEKLDMAGRLAALPVPKLYLAGVPDGCSTETHRLLAAAGVPKVDISPSGHWPFIDRVADFCRELGAFLARM